MLDLKKYYGEMKKLTIAELVLNAVTFLCILFLFVLPCFTASVEYNPDILISESENAVQKIFYDKVRAALRAELLQGNDPETITFSFSIAEEIKLIISAFRSGYSELYILFMLYFLIPVAFGAGFLCTSASNAVKRCKRLFSNEIGNATLLFFNDIKTGTDKKKKKNAYDQYNAVSVVILIVVEMIFFRWFGANLSFMAHASGISAVGYFAILLALIACGFNFYTNKQKKKLKTTLLKADYEDRQAVEAALQRSPFDLHTPAENAPKQHFPPQAQPSQNQPTPPLGQQTPPAYTQATQNMQAFYPPYMPAYYVPYTQMPAEAQPPQQQPPRQAQMVQPQPTAQQASQQARPTAGQAAPTKPNDTNK